MDFNLRLVYFWLYLFLGFASFVGGFIFMSVVFITGVTLVYWPIFVVIFYSYYIILDSNYRPFLWKAFVRPEIYVEYFWNQYHFLISEERSYKEQKKRRESIRKEMAMKEAEEKERRRERELLKNERIEKDKQRVELLKNKREALAKKLNKAIQNSEHDNPNLQKAKKDFQNGINCRNDSRAVRFLEHGLELLT